METILLELRRYYIIPAFSAGSSSDLKSPDTWRCRSTRSSLNPQKAQPSKLVYWIRYSDDERLEYYG